MINKYIIITLWTLNCINTILSDFFEGGEVVYRLYYLKEEHIIIWSNIVCIIMFTLLCDDRYY